MGAREFITSLFGKNNHLTKDKYEEQRKKIMSNNLETDISSTNLQLKKDDNNVNVKDTAKKQKSISQSIRDKYFVSGLLDCDSKRTKKCRADRAQKYRKKSVNNLKEYNIDVPIIEDQTNYTTQKNEDEREI